MKISLWRKLFPLSYAPPGATDADSMVFHIKNLIDNLFPGAKNDGGQQHGGKNWYMDQIILGCTVDIAMEAGYTVDLAPGPRDRLGIGGEIWKPYTDIHLAQFKLSENWWWLDNLVDNSVVLMHNRQKYRQYTAAWKKHFNLNF